MEYLTVWIWWEIIIFRVVIKDLSHHYLIWSCKNSLSGSLVEVCQLSIQLDVHYLDEVQPWLDLVADDFYKAL